MNDRRRGDRGVETEPPRSAGARFRESAAVVIVRGHGDSLEVFWVKRSDAVGYMPGIQAFVGGTVLPGSPADYAKLIAEEIEKWGTAVKFSGAKPD